MYSYYYYHNVNRATIYILYYENNLFENNKGFDGVFVHCICQVSKTLCERETGERACTRGERVVSKHIYIYIYNQDLFSDFPYCVHQGASYKSIFTNTSQLVYCKGDFPSSNVVLRPILICRVFRSFCICLN